MLTETLSGKCPCCNYNKMLQRYGSSGYYQLEGCPKCGFGYGTNHHETEESGPNCWLDYGLHIVSFNFQDSYQIYNNFCKLSYYKKRELIFKSIDKEERFDDISNTIFEYSKEEIETYRKSKPLIFSSNILIEFI